MSMFTNLLIWVTALCVIGLIWNFGIKAMLLDGLRERLFQLRSELFSLAVEGEISYSDPAYRSFEMLLCGLLRFAHRITFLTYCFSVYQQSLASKDKNRVDLGQQIALRVSRLDATTQEKLNRITIETRNAVFLYMFLSSVPLFTLVSTRLFLKYSGLLPLEDTKSQLISPIEEEAYRCEKRKKLRVAYAY